MGLYDEFKFKPSRYLPHCDLPLEELERVRNIKREDMEEVDFIIIEDIIDSGRTLAHLVRYLKERGANSVRTCTLLDKPERRVVDFVPDYLGKTIPDEFVVGFGLDYQEKYRNLPFIAVLKPEVYTS